MEPKIQFVLQLLEDIPTEYRESAFPLLLNHSLTMERLTFAKTHNKGSLEKNLN
jgi:hypothetical protein